MIGSVSQTAQFRGVCQRSKSFCHSPDEMPQRYSGRERVRFLAVVSCPDSFVLSLHPGNLNANPMSQTTELSPLMVTREFWREEFVAYNAKQQLLLPEF
jgi:hypothetical protein